MAHDRALAEDAFALMLRIEALTAKLSNLCGIFNSCVNCTNFTKDELCSLNNKRPPADIIAFGCEYFDSKIPF